MIDINKKYTTRDGHPVRIYATDCGGDYPVQGTIKRNGEWHFETWTADGRVCVSVRQSPDDLIEVKPRIKGWLNVYRNCSVYLYSTREAADMGASPNRIACIEIDVPHGYGLEACCHGETKP